jgi:hypothetical protein
LLAWTSKVPDSDDLNVALLNTGDAKKDISLSLAERDLSPTNRTNACDLWLQQDVCPLPKGVLTGSINTNGALLYRLSPATNAQTRRAGFVPVKPSNTGD